MEYWDEVRDSRYKVRGKYKFDTWIFNLMVFLLIFSFYKVAQAHNYDLDYYACIDPPSEEIGEYGIRVPLTGAHVGQCKNPFYKKETAWKGQEYLYPAEYGTPYSTWLLKLVGGTLGALLLAFVVNHFVHNFGKKNEKTEEEKLHEDTWK